jgi:PAS domain S-box-containing protein
MRRVLRAAPGFYPDLGREAAPDTDRAAPRPGVTAMLEVGAMAPQVPAASDGNRARHWFVESLDRVNRAIQGTNDLEQMMTDVLDASLSIFDCDRAWLVYPCDPNARWQGVQVLRAKPEFPRLYPRDLPMDAEAAEVFRVVRAASGPVQFGPVAPQHPLSATLAERLGIRSRIAVALYPKGDQPYMFGLSQCAYPRVWTTLEQQLFEEIGRRLADALTSLSIVRSLRESEKRYRHIFESTGVAILEHDFSAVKAAIDELKASGVRDVGEYCAAHPEFIAHARGLVKIRDANDMAVALFEAGTKEQLLASAQQLHDSFDAFVSTLVAIADRRSSFEGESVMTTLKGERLTVLFTITFPRPPARLDSVLVTVTDITRRTRAEYLTTLVFESSPDGMVIIGRDYRYRRINGAYARRWGKPPESIVGMHMADLIGTEEFERVAQPNLDRCFAGDEIKLVGWFSNPQGRQFLGVTCSPLRPDSERVEAALVVSRDLTELATASEALQRAQVELAHVTRITTLGELAASIAHEVNQPLAAMVADAEASINWLAAAEPDLEQVRDALSAIVHDGHRAGEVVQRIRQLAQKTDPQRGAVAINDLIGDMQPLLRPEVRRHDVSLRLDLAPTLRPVYGDRVQLQQVLINLVMNGMEAMATISDRPRELVIRSQPHDTGVLVAVEDAGVGLDETNMAQLFDAFFTTKKGGMGMGLSISRSIIEAHGGRLWATMNAKHGATFHFTVPALG